MTDIFLARQPILDRDQSVQGYELMYPQRNDEETPASNGALASARVVLTAFSEIGLEHLVGLSPAWIKVTPEFTRLDVAPNLPPERVVLELSGRKFLHESMIEPVGKLRDAGYRLALDEFEVTPEFDALLRTVDIVKLDMHELGGRELARRTFKLRPYGLTVAAKNIETPDEFKLAVAAGADLFQGFFFCRPHLIGGRRVPPSRVALLQLASALQDPEVQLRELEQLISRDVALSYRLLKYINSAYFSLRGAVSSIRQAVALLGIEQLRSWATLTIFADVGDKPRELYMTALVRARFCQQAGGAQDGPKPELFTLGLFSVLDALTDTSMRIALHSLPLTPAMREALIHHTGPGRLLDCVIAIENGEFDRATEIVGNASTHYIDAVAWSNSTGKQLVA
jgi:EAL and modified HD-GYP domain-containing signal transduction protein